MISKETINKILEFRKKRDWNQFHTIKDLCLGIGIEVSELQEIFLWKTDVQIDNIKKDKIKTISEELADIFIFLTYITDDLGVDLNAAVNEKIRINEIKYPVSKSKGSNKKYNDL